MEPNIWQNELREIINLKSQYQIDSQKIIKELDCLVEAQNDEVALLYTRRTLEVIVTEICEDKLHKERGNEPLLSIIDRLHREKHLPDFAHASMQNLNKIATFGVHPKEFDTNQVRTALLELVTVIKWYAKEKNYIKIEAVKQKNKITTEKKEDKTENIYSTPLKKKSKSLFIITVSLIIVVLISLSIAFFNNEDNTNEIADTLPNADNINTTKNNSDTPKKDTIKTNTVTDIVAVNQVLKKDVPENIAVKSTKTKTIQTDKPENIQNLFDELNNTSVYNTKESLKSRILNICDKNARVVYADNPLLESKPIEEYLNKLFFVKVSVTVKNREINPLGKISIIEVTEAKK